MSYAAREDGPHSGAPVELWQFSRGTAAPTYWRFTTSDVAETYLANTYDPDVAIRELIVKSDSNTESGEISFELPLSHPISQLFVTTQVWEPIGLIIFMGHRDDSERITAFRGVVGGAAMGDVGCRLTVKSIQGRFNRRMPRQLITESCANMLYDDGCQVNRETFAFTGTVASVDGRFVEVTGLETFAGADVTYFVNGVLTKAGLVVGFITEQDGDTVRCLGKVGGVSVSDSVKVYAGCDRTLSTCKTRFNNAINRVGFKTLPTFNPFSSTTRFGGRGFKS